MNPLLQPPAQGKKGLQGTALLQLSFSQPNQFRALIVNFPLRVKKRTAFLIAHCCRPFALLLSGELFFQRQGGASYENSDVSRRKILFRVGKYGRASSMRSGWSEKTVVATTNPSERRTTSTIIRPPVLLLVCLCKAPAGHEPFGLPVQSGNGRLLSESPQKDSFCRWLFFFGGPFEPWQMAGITVDPGSHGDSLSDDRNNAPFGLVELPRARFRFARVGAEFRFCARL